MPDVSFEPVRDTSLRLEFPDSNYGATAQVFLGALYGGGAKTELWRTLFDFDVSSLAGEVIQTARLVREVIDTLGNGLAAQMHRCTRPGAWVEPEVTWKNYKAGTPWTNQGGDYSNSVPAPVFWTEPATPFAGFFTITGLKGFVDDALALRSGIVSLLLRLSDETPEAHGKTTVLSKEFPFPLERPLLIVEYGDVAVPPAERRDTDALPALGERRPAPPAQADEPAGGARPARPAGPGGVR